MQIRSFRSTDLSTLVDITIEVFGPFYEESFRAMVPPDVFTHQHGSWEGDYRRSVPQLHSPDQGRYVAVAESDDGEILGYIAWNIDPDRHHGEIDTVAVLPGARGQGLGRALCEHAMTHMRAGNVEVVELGTGGDAFHAPARALYEALGFNLVPVAVYMRGL